MTNIGTLKGISERVREKFTSAYAAWVHSKYGYGTAESRDEIAAIVVWGQAVVVRDADYIASLEAQLEALSALDGTDYYLLRWIESVAQMEENLPPERIEGFSSFDSGERFRLERLMHLGYAAPNTARERSFVITQKGREAYRLQVEEFQKRGRAE